jgi:hypothetical protein
LTKFWAEATPDKLKLILGWILDAWWLLILLPDDKFHKWLQAIDSLLKAPTELDTTTGKLNHAGFVIPLAWHFQGVWEAPTLTICSSKSKPTLYTILATIYLWIGMDSKAPSCTSYKYFNYCSESCG